MKWFLAALIVASLFVAEVEAGSRNLQRSRGQCPPRGGFNQGFREGFNAAQRSRDRQNFNDGFRQGFSSARGRGRNFQIGFVNIGR